MIHNQSPKPQVYVVTLTPTPSSVPSEVRLRRLLKMALRICDLRCTHVARTAGYTADEPPADRTGREPSDAAERISGSTADDGERGHRGA